MFIYNIGLPYRLSIGNSLVWLCVLKYIKLFVIRNKDNKGFHSIKIFLANAILKYPLQSLMYIKKLIYFNLLLPLFGSIADKRPCLPTTIQSCVPSLFVSISRQLCLDGSCSLMKGLLQVSVPSETFTPIKPEKSSSCL